MNRRIDRLRNERAQLKDRRRYEGNRRWIERRLTEIAYDLDRLKRERKDLKRIDRRRDDYRRDDYRRRGHYHGANLCYSDH